MQEGKSATSEDDLEDDDLEDDDSSQKPITTTFELNDTLYAEAELEDTDSVYLWLGVRFPPVSVFPLLNRRAARVGKCHARIQASRGHHAPPFKVRVSAEELSERDRGSRISTRTDHHHGSQHCARVQLGREAEERAEGEGG